MKVERVRLNSLAALAMPYASVAEADNLCSSLPEIAIMCGDD